MLDIKDFIKLAEEKKEIRHSIETVNGVSLNIFCYMITTPDLFKNKLERECRGVVFDNNGVCVCRTPHKFFNIGEREETLPENIKWDKITYVSNKVDGSLLTPILIDGSVFWKTKKSFFSPMAKEIQKAWNNKEEWIYKWKQNIWDFWLANETPYFEYTSPDNRIVLDYGEEKTLTLLGSRHNITGDYFVNEDNCVNIKINNYNDFIKETKELTDIEGYVLYSSNGECYKIKTSWYMDRHHLLSSISYKNIVDFIIEEKIDDVIAELRIKGFLKPLQIINQLQKEYAELLYMKTLGIQEMYDFVISTLYVDEKCSKKEFALFLQNKLSHQKRFHGILFLLFDGRTDDFERMMTDMIREIMIDKYRGKVIFMGEEQ